MIELTRKEKEMRDRIIDILRLRGRVLPSELAREVGATPNEMQRIGTSLMELSIAGPEDRR